MDWDPRRLAMLREMGIRLWLPPQPAPAEGTETQDVSVTAATAAPAAAPAVPAASRPAEAARESLPPSHPPAPPLLPRREPPASPSLGRAAQPVSGASAPAELVPAAQALTLDWPGLREAVAGCRACGLCESRRQAVFGVGNEQADWMIVGEAPGEQEDLRGEPFVGPAGQLLDNMLAAVGLGRQPGLPERQVFIANVLKCRPPHNRNPEPLEVARCAPYLKRQVELVRPKIILAMGRFAVQSLLGSTEPIGRLRGRVHRYEGVPVIVTYHPAYLLRNLPEKAKAWEDLCLALETAQAG